MAKQKRKFKKRKLIFLFIIIILIVFVVYFAFFRKSKKQESVQIEVIDSIDNFDYQLNDNETKYYTDLFNSLKDMLSKDDYNEEEYGVLVGKLFLADFYDLDSKVMKGDIGGTQFVYSDYREDFEKGAIDTVYKSVQSNVYGDRKQSLPVVKSVDKVDVSSLSFEYGYDIDYDAYSIVYKINYEKDMGYPSDVRLVLIHNNDKLEISKMEVL